VRRVLATQRAPDKSLSQLRLGNFRSRSTLPLTTARADICSFVQVLMGIAPSPGGHSLLALPRVLLIVVCAEGLLNSKPSQSAQEARRLAPRSEHSGVSRTPLIFVVFLFC